MKVLYKLIPYELQGKEITKISNESTTTVFCTHKKLTIDGKKKPSQRYLKRYNNNCNHRCTQKICIVVVHIAVLCTK